ncbi:MAG TPA: haloacid dehalogenase type II [Terriglobales bacterium]|nr:haloacid dehalogenase type II [Terriglobales bacterium]
MARNSAEEQTRRAVVAREGKPDKQSDGRRIGENRQSFSFDRFEAISFDCYGTLIDWESGLLGALRPILRRHGQNLGDAQILEIYGKLEPEAQKPYRRYREVLAEVARGFGRRLGFAVARAEEESLAESMKEWQPFPDTVAALEKLKTRFKLGIISNVDDDLFAASARHLKIKFDQVITAEQAQAYKPSLALFHLALERFGISAERVLHAGQSVYHDVLPAKSLGLATVLVYRRGFGATRPTQGTPDLQVPDLRTLAEVASPNVAGG